MQEDNFIGLIENALLTVGRFITTQNRFPNRRRVSWSFQISPAQTSFGSGRVSNPVLALRRW